MYFSAMVVSSFLLVCAIAQRLEESSDSGNQSEGGCRSAQDRRRGSCASVVAAAGTRNPGAGIVDCARCSGSTRGRCGTDTAGQVGSRGGGCRGRLDRSEGRVQLSRSEGRALGRARDRRLVRHGRDNTVLLRRLGVGDRIAGRIDIHTREHLVLTVARGEGAVDRAVVRRRVVVAADSVENVLAVVPVVLIGRVACLRKRGRNQLAIQYTRVKSLKHPPSSRTCWRP